MATASLSPSVLLLSKLVSLVSMSAPINRPAVWSGVDVRTLLLGSFLCLPSFLSHLHAKVQQHGTCPPQTAHMLPDLRRHPSAFLAQEIGAILIFCLVPHFCQAPPPATPLSGSALRPPQNPWTTAGARATSPTRFRALGRQAHVLPCANPVLSAQRLTHNRCPIHIWWASGWIPAGWSQLCENKTLSEKLWFPRKWHKLTKHTQVITQRSLQISRSKDQQKHSGAHSSRYLLMYKIK